MKAIHLTAYGNPAQNLKMVNVRPTVFLENPFFYGFAAESIRRTGELQLPFAAGESSPIAAQDVARNRRGIFEGTRTDGEIPGHDLGRVGRPVRESQWLAGACFRPPRGDGSSL